MSTKILIILFIWELSIEALYVWWTELLLTNSFILPFRALALSFMILIIRYSNAFYKYFDWCNWCWENSCLKFRLSENCWLKYWSFDDQKTPDLNFRIWWSENYRLEFYDQKIVNWNWISYKLVDQKVVDLKFEHLMNWMFLIEILIIWWS